MALGILDATSRRVRPPSSADDEKLLFRWESLEDGEEHDGKLESILRDLWCELGFLMRARLAGLLAHLPRGVELHPCLLAVFTPNGDAPGGSFTGRIPPFGFEPASEAREASILDH